MKKLLAVLLLTLAAIGAPARAAKFEVVEVTLTLDTSIYASGDVLSDTVKLPNAMLIGGGHAILRSITVIDDDDQGAALDIVFLKTNVSLGTKNSTPNISDANNRQTLGFVSIVAGDYIDQGGARVATKSGLAIVLESPPTIREIYVGTITRGTPTHTVNGLRLKIGLEQGDN